MCRASSKQIRGRREYNKSFSLIRGFIQDYPASQWLLLCHLSGYLIWGRLQVLLYSILECCINRRLISHFLVFLYFATKSHVLFVYQTQTTRVYIYLNIFSQVFLSNHTLMLDISVSQLTECNVNTLLSLSLLYILTLFLRYLFFNFFHH